MEIVNQRKQHKQKERRNFGPVIKENIKVGGIVKTIVLINLINLSDRKRKDVFSYFSFWKIRK